jgi:hypothetical protein
MMRCSCGIESREKCQSIHHAIIMKEIETIRIYSLHRVRVDAYCLQHPDIHLVSTKSFAAHLLGLCIATEYDSNPACYRAIQKWGYGNGELEKPPMLTAFGDLTIAHLLDAHDIDEFAVRVQEYAASVWKAYEVYHDLARAWLQKAMEVFR